jgi:hypothetical protein
MQNNPWNRALAQLEKAASHIDLKPDLKERLLQPDRIPGTAQQYPRTI